MTTRATERRETELPLGDAVSLDYLAMLEVCGGSIRESDRSALERHLRERRASADRQIADRRQEIDRRQRSRRAPAVGAQPTANATSEGT